MTKTLDQLCQAWQDLDGVQRMKMLIKNIKEVREYDPNLAAEVQIYADAWEVKQAHDKRLLIDRKKVFVKLAAHERREIEARQAIRDKERAIRQKAKANERLKKGRLNRLASKKTEKANATRRQAMQRLERCREQALEQSQPVLSQLRTQLQEVRCAA